MEELQTSKLKVDLRFSGVSMQFLFPRKTKSIINAKRLRLTQQENQYFDLQFRPTRLVYLGDAL